MITLNLSKILSGESEDIRLKLKDTLFIKAVKDLRERLTVSISGAINKSGTYEFADNMTVSDLVTMAGGFTDGASASKIEIARRIKGDTIGVPRSNQSRLKP